MLKRIQELRNIGRFQNCRAGGVEFGRLTIIYGRNTYGKSTVGDIFASLSTGDTSLITGRSTIPADGEAQRIFLSFQYPNTAGESGIQFERGTWSHTIPPALGVKTFDDGFLHKNLFAARAVTRATKENFSAYILGEQGVQQAKIIAEKKRERQQLTRDQNTLVRDAFGNIDDIPAFVSLEPTGTKTEKEAALQDLRTEYAALTKQLTDVDEIQGRSEGEELNWSASFSQSMEIINGTLLLGLEGTHKAAKALVTEHIENHFRESHGAARWIREGLNQTQTDACQFCGQLLSDDAKALMDVYRQAFDAEFDRHENMVKARLHDSLNALSRRTTDSIRAALGQNAAALAGFPELIENVSFSEARDHLRTTGAEIESSLTQWDERYDPAVETVRAACELKKQAPQTPLPAIDMQAVIGLEVALGEKVDRYNEALRMCIARIREFKQSSNATAIQERLNAVTAAERQTALSLARINLNNQCTRHREITAQMARLDEEIPILETQLRDDQSDYLQRFFDSLNTWFRKFGSREFTLERAEVSRGHTPIYFLRVKYRGVDINERDLERVFSESDRRALALAVYWTQLQELPGPEKARQIVVLDDPLTSFDDGRVTAVHSELVAALDGVRQIIVLSHYAHEIRCFLEKYNNLEGLRLLSLETRPDGAHLVSSEPAEFIRSEHEKARQDLTGFADGNLNECEFGTLRVFFEQELNSRFAAQIANNNLGALLLNAKIDGLAANNVLSDVTMKKCHHWRAILNPPHHSWSSNDLEDRRNTTRDLLDFIYYELVPT